MNARAIVRAMLVAVATVSGSGCDLRLVDPKPAGHPACIVRDTTIHVYLNPEKLHDTLTIRLACR